MLDATASQESIIIKNVEFIFLLNTSTLFTFNLIIQLDPYFFIHYFSQSFLLHSFYVEELQWQQMVTTINRHSKTSLNNHSACTLLNSIR